MDIKADIARCVRSFTWDSAGIDCLFRAVQGFYTLRLLGFEPSLEIGSILYRAGHDPARDVVAFHSPDNNSGTLVDGDFYGHFWLELFGEIIDFTSGDWRWCDPEDDLAEVDWVCSPPEFIWANKLLFGWQEDGAPSLGDVWYGPWIGEWPDVAGRLAPMHELIIEQCDGVLRENLARMYLSDRCSALALPSAIRS
jgi:hypothetical protein